MQANLENSDLLDCDSNQLISKNSNEAQSSIN